MAPMKLAIIGGGPSAFYVASRILSLLPQSVPESSALRVHLYDRLWAPHGLVRYGVAPDHPEVKMSHARTPAAVAKTLNCTNKFDAAAGDPRLKFFGNVNVGSAPEPLPNVMELPLSSIYQNYSHVLFATGCTQPTLHSAIPPSSHCIPALSLVHWYTQHPAHTAPPPLDKLSHVSLIGNGNVSLDVARMLLTPVSTLSKYDVPKPVLDVLSRSTVKHVSIIGRRGPLEAAFTTKELRELIHLPDSSMVPMEPSLLAPPKGSSLTRQQSRIMQLLQKGSNNPYGTTPKTWSLDFFRSPTGLVPPSSGTSSLAQLALAHTTLDANLRAVPSGETSTLPTSLVITSLGFHGEPLAPYYDPALGHLRTLAGRVVSSSGHPLRNVYASGWAATGAKGVLAATMINAYAIADTILQDWKPKGQLGSTTPEEAGAPLREEQAVMEGGLAESVLNVSPDLESVPREVEEGIRNGVVLSYEDWKKVDAEEVRRGEALGKERERMGWEDARSFLAST